MNKQKFGYPLHLFDLNPHWRRSFLFTLIVVLVSSVFFILYSHLSTDLAPDSFAGYTFAIAGTFFLGMAALRYTMHKRSRKREVGKLNKELYWHISFGTIALVVLTFHSFGNFNPRSGTFALYGMIALVVSGFIGRLLDRVLSRQITIEASKALTMRGDDRAESISQTLQAIVEYNAQNIKSVKAPASSVNSQVIEAPVRRGDSILQSSWDLAYISLEETPQEVQRNNGSYRFVPDRRSALAQPGALLPGMQDQVNELQIVEQALQREQVYRYIIRFWRIFHVLLLVLTIGLTLWHLEYAAQLLLPTFMQH
ncbi:hypothetical protein [Tengunoibacter tsumagoiensis]|uniref:Uncharacterized protein n=1 Tax=Tengunoibacter tsumagoiensis TaxID=2014871 RepID=A0A401ZUR9_9CHLR|nr:hypothetical protein [Tengunoibacter tsumagoiensis]GCE10623.1 hypothetical protein KTT_04820 [Tengunoibacter tsumagoiensis]